MDDYVHVMSTSIFSPSQGQILSDDASHVGGMVYLRCKDYTSFGMNLFFIIID